MIIDMLCMIQQTAQQTFPSKHTCIVEEHMCKQMSKRDANTLLQLFLVHVDVATTNSKLK